MKKTGQCHCGAVKFEVFLSDENIELNRCNCSLCRKKGAVMTSVPISNVEILEGLDVLKLYQWNTKVAKHYFCSICGIYTHHQRRSMPEHYAVNVACFDGPDITEGREVGILDGASNSIFQNEN